LKELILKYKHGWVLSYFFIYIIWFFALEQNVTTKYTPVYIWLDDFIPFNEWFVIPYYLWFAYIFITVAYFFLTSKEDFYKVTAFLFIGMTICLIIYTVWPNGQNLRPDLATIGRNNIFIDIVRNLYNTDTSTNVCPSIHVFNSIGAHIAIHHSTALKKYKWIQAGSFVLMMLIILSTMFLKQHSAFDAITAIALSIVMYLFVYVFSSNRQLHRLKQKKVVVDAN
jgi:membrane-associated phospholipid phosphatase